MNEYTPESGLMKTDREVGIVGYGAYVPRYRLPAAEVSRMWTGGKGGLPIIEKAVPGLDEDVVIMSIEAARNAGHGPGPAGPRLRIHRCRRRRGHAHRTRRRSRGHHRR